ncbi:helix-turn-helix domain-containing protein [Streptomyces sp. NPDC056480]
MEKGKHYWADIRDECDLAVRALYEQGAVIRELAQAAGRSIRFAHHV